MYRNSKINPVFLACEDKVPKYKPIVASGPPRYRPEVKIHDWQSHVLVEPRDNKTGNFRQSSYKRFGTDEEPIGISTTRAMTEQIYTKNDDVSKNPYRSMLSIHSFSMMETNEDENESDLELERSDSIVKKSAESIDYGTTSNDDYKWHFPKISKPLEESIVPDVPWMLYRRIHGYSSDDLERRPGVGKFLDDNMEIQNRAAILKMPRFVSFNPMIGQYTDACYFSEAILKNILSNCSS